METLNLEVFNSYNSSQSPPLSPRLIPLQLLYGMLNKLLRDEDRAKLKPFFPYLKVLLTALERLPDFKKMVGGGMRWGSGGEGGRAAVLFSSSPVPRPTLTQTHCQHLGDLTLLV